MNSIDLSSYQLNTDKKPIPTKLYNSGIHDSRIIEKVLKIIYTDPLTQSYNRQYYNDIIERENIINNRQTQNYFAMIDIDHFKSVNDTYGHNVGDVVLQVFAKKLKESTNLNVIRYGGEEFMLISHSPGVLQEKIKKTRQEITRTVFVSDEKKFTINFSCGIGKNPKEADQTLYQAKKTGRAQTCLSPRVELKQDMARDNFYEQEFKAFEFDDIVELSISR
jgi:diguanylate cyclase (GGDEF)-like protein